MSKPLDQRARYELAHFGEAVGDPSRAAMLVALMGGTRRPAGELARVARVSASTASEHLRKLVGAGLLVSRPAGRHRYYELAGPRVAQAVEALVTLSEPRPVVPRAPSALATSRLCYAHLAGRVAVDFWSRASEAGWVRWSEEVVALLPAGVDALERQGLTLPARRGLLGRPCLDWSERVPHVSGGLGVGVSEAMLECGWLVRGEGRALRVTTRGRRALEALGVRGGSETTLRTSGAPSSAPSVSPRPRGRGQRALGR